MNNRESPTQQKMKKLRSRGKTCNKRKRRTNSEKHIEERDDEIPWPPPTEAAIALYNQLINADFKLTNFEHSAVTSTNVLPNKQSLSSSDNDLESVHQKLDQLLEDQSRNQSSGPNVGTSRSPHYTGGPIVTASSQDVCTLFTNKCHISSGERMALPPIGVFWDIENCSVPKGRSALVAVQRIRERFFGGHYEAEFVCVCDIRKESPSVIQELNDAQVSVVHVSGNSKNAADDKLRQAMRRFADIYSNQPLAPSSASLHPATIILISGDINFSSDLSDLRHRKRLYVILLHNKHAPEALLICAHEQFEFHSMLANLPPRPMHRDNSDPNNKQIPLKGGLQAVDLLVCDLPFVNSKSHSAIRNRLRKLSENCGGKVVTMQGNLGLVRFPNKEAALRASKRMNGEDVLGSKIRVLYSSQMEFQQSQIGTASSSHQSRNQRESSLGPSWKPTWINNKKGPTDGANALRPIRSCLNQSVKATHVSFQSSLAAPVSVSNSSSPYESSREVSPSGGKRQPLSIQATPLNNSLQQQLSQTTQSQQQAMIPSLNANSAFAFHQNLFPMHHSGMNLTTQQQVDEVQLQSQQQNNDFSATPRLYSTSFVEQITENNIPSNLNSSQINSQADSSTVASNSAPISGIFSVSSGTGGIHPSTSANSHFMSTPSAPFQFGNSPIAPLKSKHDMDHFDLHVTNIDPSLGDWKVIRHSLITAFGEHVGLKGVWVYVSQDGSVSSVVRVNNKEEAHYAVAQLHRKKIGNKRIFISFDQGGNVDQETLKKEVASLLQDVPGASLPLFKFREMFEKRYRRSVSSSDLYRLRDVVAISENSTNSCATGPNVGRTISLSTEWKSKEDKNVSLYCTLHPPKKAGSERMRTGWAEKEAEVLLPCAVIELKVLSNRVHSLLNSHGSAVPLISFLDCYEAEFGTMERAAEGVGVPLEHLLSCVQGVEIAYGDNGMKRIQWNEKKELEAGMITQPLATQLAQFGREMVDLLKTFPRCSLAFSKLIPAYHHHFGRQCRVADYGHFNLHSLLQTLPHVVQILGAAQNRILTLSHKAQMKRFATDLLRVLKAHGGAKKQVKVEDFPQAFTQVFVSREFHAEDYGLCYLSDLISSLVENSTLVALVKDEDGNQMLAVPKREQTPQEIHRTRMFASEVIELLRHSIRYEMPFSKFIPAYHHHFGKQCRVSDYGFSKLAELFEAIHDTVVCVSPTAASSDCNTEDRLIRLIPQEQVKVVGEQLSALLEKQTEAGKTVRLSEVDELFIDEHGFQLRPEMCDAEDIDDLIKNKLGRYITEENGFLTVVDRHEMEVLSQDATAILEQHPEYKMDLDEFLKCFLDTYEIEIDVAMIERNLSHALIVSQPDEDGKRTIALAPLRIFAREIAQLLEDCGLGSLMIANVETAYLQKFNRPLRPAQMGYPSLLALLQAVSDVVEVRGKHRSKKVCLVGHPSSDTSSLEDSFRSQKSRYNDSFSRDRNATRPYSADHARSANNSRLKLDSGRWSDSPKHRRAPAPPPLFAPSMPSPGFSGRQHQEPSVFTFDRPAPLSPPVYDLWMRDTMSPGGTPPLSPPVVWTYHPIVYPPPATPPATSGSILMPTHFSYSGPWSPPIPSACYDGMTSQTGNMMGNEYMFEQQSRLVRGVERLGLGMDGRNEA